MGRIVRVWSAWRRLSGRKYFRIASKLIDQKLIVKNTFQELDRGATALFRGRVVFLKGIKNEFKNAFFGYDELMTAL